MSESFTEDEDLVMSTRPHARALFGPIALLLAMAALVGVVLAWLPPENSGLIQLLIVAVGLTIVLVVGLPVVVRWATTKTVLTSKRLTTRWGLFRSGGNDLPLSRVVDVTYTRTAIDYIFGSGTLVVTNSASEDVILKNLPQIKWLHEAMATLVAEQEAWH